MSDHACQPPGELVPEHWVSRAVGPHGSPVEFEGLDRGPAVTAPKAHLYGGKSHDQPSSSPMPMVSMTWPGPRPGRSRSRATQPDRTSQKRLALPPSSKSRCRAGSVTPRAASREDGELVGGHAVQERMGGQSGRVDLDHGTSPPSVCLGRLSLGGTARSWPGPKVTRRPGPLATKRCDGARAWSMDQRPGRTWRRPLATGLRPAEAGRCAGDNPARQLTEPRR